MTVNVEVFLGKDKGNRFVFKMLFTESYPHKAPEVYLQPNSYLMSGFLAHYSNYIDMTTGRVHLPILTTAWNPVLDFMTIIFELQLFISNPESVSTTFIEIYDLWTTKLKVAKSHDCKESMMESDDMKSEDGNNSFLQQYPTLKPLKRKRSAFESPCES